MSDQPIGIFDSGVGGLTVLRSIEERLCSENLIYFADTARMPYGPKANETVAAYFLECADFLCSLDIKLLVVACNTASAAAFDFLNTRFPFPVVNVVIPGVRSVVRLTRSGKIGVIGTKGTIASGIYQRKIVEQQPSAIVTAISCPLLASLVEERLWDHPATTLLLNEYLRPILESDIDTLLLGCTHYPIVKPVIEQLVGPNVSVIDSASVCAEEVDFVLLSKGIKNPSLNKGNIKFYVSDDPNQFRLSASVFLGRPINQITMNRQTPNMPIYPQFAGLG